MYIGFFPTFKSYCNSYNIDEAVYCTRLKGHTGICWSKWEKVFGDSKLRRAEWMMYENGEFNFNSGYKIINAENANKSV